MEVALADNRKGLLESHQPRDIKTGAGAVGEELPGCPRSTRRRARRSVSFRLLPLPSPTPDLGLRLFVDLDIDDAPCELSRTYQRTAHISTNTRPFYHGSLGEGGATEAHRRSRHRRTWP